ncbi:tetratricopeptide repeat protein [Saccharopolyspora sp. NPDC002376]
MVLAAVALAVVLWKNMRVRRAERVESGETTVARSEQESWPRPSGAGVYCGGVASADLDDVVAGSYGGADGLDSEILDRLESVAGAEREHGPASTVAIKLRSDLAGAYQGAGWVEDAIALFQQVVADLGQLGDCDREDMAIAQGNLGSAYDDAGCLDEASRRTGWTRRSGSTWRHWTPLTACSGPRTGRR